MGLNSSVWKDKVRISLFAVDGLDKNPNVCKNRARIPTFGRIRQEFWCA